MSRAAAGHVARVFEPDDGGDQNGSSRNVHLDAFCNLYVYHKLLKFLCSS